MKTAIFLFFLAFGMSAAGLTYLAGGFVLMASGFTFLVLILGALVAITLRERPTTSREIAVAA